MLGVCIYLTLVFFASNPAFCRHLWMFGCRQVKLFAMHLLADMKKARKHKEWKLDPLHFAYKANNYTDIGTFPGRFKLKCDQQTDIHSQFGCFTHFLPGKVTFPGRFKLKCVKQTDIHSQFGCFTHFLPGKVTFPGRFKLKCVKQTYIHSWLQ